MTVAETCEKLAMTKVAPLAALGALASAAENRYVGESLSPELKNVNLGMGALTGAAVGIPGLTPAERGMILAAYPLKSMALFGTGAIDQYRRSQQDLVNTNLSTAKINQRTAQTQADNAGSRKAMALAFLVPALLGGGGMAYYAWNKRKKEQAARYKATDTRGALRGRQRIRIDVPATSMPDEFYRSLLHADDDPRARTQMQELLSKDVMGKAAAFMKKAEGADWAGGIADFAKELTGVPALARGVREAPRSLGYLAGGDFDNAQRYGLASLGSAAAGLAGLRWVGIPAAARLIGGQSGQRLAAMLGRQGTKGNWALRQFPTLTRPLWRWSGYANRLAGKGAVNAAGKPIARYAGESQAALRSRLGLSMKGPRDRAMNIANRTDKTRFAWVPPAGANDSFLKRTLLRAPTNKPTTMPGHLLSGMRYGLNRGVDAAYRTKQFMGRYPTGTMSLASMPLVGQGLLRDKEEAATAKREMQTNMPDWARNRGNFNMPVSAGLQALVSTVSGQQQNGGLMRQIQGPMNDPWRNYR